MIEGTHVCHGTAKRPQLRIHGARHAANQMQRRSGLLSRHVGADVADHGLDGRTLDFTCGEVVMQRLQAAGQNLAKLLLLWSVDEDRRPKEQAGTRYWITNRKTMA